MKMKSDLLRDILFLHNRGETFYDDVYVFEGMDVSETQTRKKLGTWEPSSRTFLKKSPDIFQKSKICLLLVISWFLNP